MSRINYIEIANLAIRGQYDHDAVNMQWSDVDRAIALDVARSLREIRNILQCGNFLAIPHKLDRIAKNTTKKRKRKVRS